MQLPASKSQEFTDALVTGFTGATTTLEELGEAFKFLGPQAALAGVDLQETGAILATLAEGGQFGSTAGTGARKVFTDLAKTTGAGADLFRGLGIETIDKTTGKVRHLADIVDEVNTAFAGQGPAAKQDFSNRVFGQRGGAAFNALLLRGGNEIRRFTKEMKDNIGIAKRLQEIQENTLTGSFKLMTSAISGAAIALGKELNVVIRPTVIMLTEMIGVVQHLIKIAPRFTSETLLTAGAFAALAAALPLVVGSAKLFLFLLTPMVIKLGAIAFAIGSVIFAASRLAVAFGLVSSEGGMMKLLLEDAFIYLEDVVTSRSELMELAVLKLATAMGFLFSDANTNAGRLARIFELEGMIAKRMADNATARNKPGTDKFGISEELKKLEELLGGPGGGSGASAGGIQPRFIDAIQAWKRVNEQLMGQDKNAHIKKQTNATNNNTASNNNLRKTNEMLIQKLDEAIKKPRTAIFA